jgi:hypothetical protein
MAVGYTEIILRGDSDPEVKEGRGLVALVSRAGAMVEVGRTAVPWFTRLGKLARQVARLVSGACDRFGCKVGSQSVAELIARFLFYDVRHARRREMSAYD